MKRELLRVLYRLASSRWDSALSFVLVSAMAVECRRVSGYRSRSGGYCRRLGNAAGTRSVTSHLAELRSCDRRSCGVRVVITHRSLAGTCWNPM
jgi:hypothetical protein